MTKRRVSAKQRMELVEEALANLKATANTLYGTNVEDYVQFEEAVEEALTSALEPRVKLASEVINE